MAITFKLPTKIKTVEGTSTGPKVEGPNEKVSARPPAPLAPTKPVFKDPRVASKMENWMKDEDHRPPKADHIGYSEYMEGVKAGTIKRKA